MGHQSSKQPLNLANPIVCFAAADGKVWDLVTALETNPELIDAPYRLKLNQSFNCRSLPPECDCATPLWIAARFGHATIIEKLLEKNSKALDQVNTLYDWSPLHIAAQHGYAMVVMSLLRAGSTSLDRPDSRHGWTPLHFAASNGDVQTIRALLAEGSRSLDTATKYGTTPLLFAAGQGNSEAVEVLLAAGCRTLDSRDLQGRTALLFAAERGHANVVEVLLRAGADCESAGRDLSVPLFVAAQLNHVEIVQMLLAAKPASCGSSFNPSVALERRVKDVLVRMTEHQVLGLRSRIYFRSLLAALLVLL